MRRRKGITLLKKDGTPCKVFRNIVIQPDKDPGDSPDFFREIVMRRIQMGYEQAEHPFKRFVFCS